MTFDWWDLRVNGIPALLRGLEVVQEVLNQVASRQQLDHHAAAGRLERVEATCAGLALELAQCRQMLSRLGYQVAELQRLQPAATATETLIGWQVEATPTVAEPGGATADSWMAGGWVEQYVAAVEGGGGRPLSGFRGWAGRAFRTDRTQQMSVLG